LVRLRCADPITGAQPGHRRRPWLERRADDDASRGNHQPRLTEQIGVEHGARRNGPASSTSDNKRLLIRLHRTQLRRSANLDDAEVGDLDHLPRLDVAACDHDRHLIRGSHEDPCSEQCSETDE
jgi:hypothetical protein